MKNRIYWIDAAKGFGIIVIMLSHAYSFEGMQYLTAGYIPLFFMLSGLTLKYENSQINMRKKTFRLLIPYFVYGIILGIIFSLPYFITNWNKEDLYWGWLGLFYSRYSIFIHEGVPERIINAQLGFSPMWFLTAMFVSFIYVHLVFLSQKRWIKMIYALSGIYLTFYLSHIEVLLPWSLDESFFLGFFILVSVKFKNLIIDIVCNGWNFIPIVLIYIVLVYYNGEINLSIRQYGIWGDNSIPICFVIGVLYTLLCCMFFKAVANTVFFRFFVWVGGRTIILMCLHYPIYKIIDSFLHVAHISCSLGILAALKVSTAVIICLVIKNFFLKKQKQYPLLKWL